MKNIVGVIKEIDKLGRIVIPKEMHDRLALANTVRVKYFNYSSLSLES